MEGMKSAASGVVGDLARARIALDERGQKLGELEERTAAMMASADSFSKHAHDVHTSLFLAPLHSLGLFLRFSLFSSPDDDKIQRQEMVPALMAFEKDRTLKSRKSPVSLKNCRSPFSFLRFPSQAQQQTTQLLNSRMLSFSAPYKLCFTSAATDGGQQHRHWLTQSDENGKKWKNVCINLSFHYTWWS